MSNKCDFVVLMGFYISLQKAKAQSYDLRASQIISMLTLGEHNAASAVTKLSYLLLYN